MAQLGKCKTGNGVLTQNCCVNDGVCCTVIVQQGDTREIWINTTNFTINGTVLVENKGLEGAPPVNVQVNGTDPGQILPGECLAVTYEDMDSIILITGVGTGTAEIVVSWSLNYCFEC